MNGEYNNKQDGYKAFLLLSEIEKEESLSQRDLAGRLGIALGLVNSYLKNLVAKGYVRVTTFPRNRYAYLLTPQGLAEKSRLAYQHLSYFTSLYTSTRQDYLDLFRKLIAQGVREVTFCGVDEVAEIAYLSLCEAGLSLSTIMDDERTGEIFFGREILSLSEGVRSGSSSIVLTSLKKGNALQKELLRLGVEAARLHNTAQS
jgi:DNA-binding MarR family transcriptional regulator